MDVFFLVFATAFALAASGVSCFYFLRANQCACINAKHCNKPIDLYWSIAVASAFLSLLGNCFAFHSQLGSLTWVVMMVSCFSGAYLSGWHSNKKRCRKSMSKPINDLLIND
jgi:hypothetical protein